MEFQGQGRPFDRDGMQGTCDLLGVSQPEVWAVLTVETKGFGFLPDRRPQILFERHIFHKLTNGGKWGRESFAWRNNMEVSNERN